MSEVLHELREELREPWERLQAETASDTFFATWTWCGTWWKHFDSDAKLAIVMERGGCVPSPGRGGIVVAPSRQGGVARPSLVESRRGGIAFLARSAMPPLRGSKIRDALSPP
jgi:hypothetical protein